MRSVKIIGAGSVGNHLAQAARRMGWRVCVVDADKKALTRMRTEIYPSRYGAWDDAIELFLSGDAPKGGFDVICIGTPPDVRMGLALDALREKPRVLQLEKPLCAPFDPHLRKFVAAYRKQKRTVAVVGYDHAISKSIRRVVELLRRRAIGDVLTLDAEFREHWRGIFAAHPWLKGPADTYLGYSSKGGGASGEHSHALHLFGYLSRAAGLGEWKSVCAALQVEKEGTAEYDSFAAFTFRFASGKIGRVAQDVITLPTRKWARLQGERGFIEWHCGGVPEGDIVRFARRDGKVREEVFAKKRPDDFYAEMRHIGDILHNRVRAKDSPLFLESALSVMSVLETVWRTHARAARTLTRVE